MKTWIAPLHSLCLCILFCLAPFAFEPVMDGTARTSITLVIRMANRLSDEISHIEKSCKQDESDYDIL